ncbi:N-acetylneuraminate lyase [Brevinema andersonii]|uniref:N-acetylneuraminate lyase n=1 Tax=Brevinema andersonii TaxID=34097 RepID=A0A1I1ERK1_BREAD|nr:dihydrodipicolinate synthase family protein [Brevinema andersonii]SFB87550.1 N-acetylneuraminate lyase [Brevinema andersonii]
MLNKYKGIFPAFYACYDDQGNISPERIHNLVEFYISKGIKGLYVGGSSGECIYQTFDERKIVLKEVMKVAKNRLIIIAHVGMPSTRDSIILAEYAKECGVDALSSIPPIYFPLSDQSVEEYWGSIAAATDLDFFIYNIPQFTNYSLSKQVYQNLLNYPQIVGVKNSSIDVLDIITQKMYATKEVIVFNGPDEQYLGGRIMGADGGIGGTYGVMPELYLKLEELFISGNLVEAQKLQMAINEIIFELCGFSGHMYSVIKAILKLKGINIGTVRAPLMSVNISDLDKIQKLSEKIEYTVSKFQ